MTLGQRVAVMRDGEFQQVAPPMEVYTRPANRFVAGFVGSPAMNFIPCRVRRDRDGPVLDCERFEVSLAGDPTAEPGVTGDLARQAAEGRELILGIRPQDIRLADGESQADARGRVDVVEPLGSEVLLHVAMDGHVDGEEEVRALVPPEAGVRVEDSVGLRFRRDRLHLFDAVSGRRVEESPGDRQMGSPPG